MCSMASASRHFQHTLTRSRQRNSIATARSSSQAAMMASGTLHPSVALECCQQWPCRVVESSMSAWLVVGSRIWDTSTGQCLKTLIDEDNPPVYHPTLPAFSFGPIAHRSTLAAAAAAAAALPPIAGGVCTLCCAQLVRQLRAKWKIHPRRHSGQWHRRARRATALELGDGPMSGGPVGCYVSSGVCGDSLRPYCIACQMRSIYGLWCLFMVRSLWHRCYGCDMSVSESSSHGLTSRAEDGRHGRPGPAEPEGQMLPGRPEGQMLTGRPEGQMSTGRPEGQMLTSRPEGQMLPCRPERQMLTGPHC